MNTAGHYSQRDEMLFEELDTYSQHLRSAAGHLHSFIGKIKHKPKELIALNEAVEKIKKTVIENMDDAILELNRNAQLVTSKLGEASPHHSSQSLQLSQVELSELIEKLDALAIAATKLTRKANELNQRS